MAIKIDKETIKSIADQLYISLTDEEIAKVIADLQDLENNVSYLSALKAKVEKLEPAEGPKVKSCATFRKDVASDYKDNDYFKEAKVQDKFVVGK